MPPSSTGFSLASASRVVSRRPWSRVTTVVSPVGCLVDDGAYEHSRGRSGPRPRRAAPWPASATPKRVDVLAGHARAAWRCARRPRTGWAGRCPTSRAGGVPALVADVGAAAAPGSSPRRRRRCRRRWRRPRSGRRRGGWPAGRSRTGSRSVVAAGPVRQAGVQPGGAGDVVRLLAGLGDAAADDLLDQCAGRCRSGRGARAARRRGVSAACRPDSQPPRLPIGVRTASTITGAPTRAPSVLETRTCSVSGQGRIGGLSIAGDSCA